jgi:hypothetical protein
MKKLFTDHCSLITIISWIIALVAIACGLLVFESHYLWKVQELNLFLGTPLFLKQQMVVPAGMLTYVGTWLTQLLYYPWLGVTVLCGWWLLLLFLMKRTFAVPARWAPLLLIPVGLLLITNVDLGYWIYILKLRGHFFLTTIGTTAVVALLWGFRSLPDKYFLRAVWMVLTCVVGYPLMGIYGLAATLLMGLWAWRLMSRGRAAVYSVIAIVTAVAVPLLCYCYVYHETNLANIYYAGLPLFYVTERYAQYYIPYILLALFMICMVCLPKVKQTSQKVNQSTGQQAGKRKSKKVGKWIPWVEQAAVVAVVTWGVVHFWYKDENFHHEVKMQHLIDQTDWKGVLKEAAAQQDEPTRAIVMMRNLALSRLGRQGDVMYQYRNGSKRYNAPFDMRLMMVVGTLVYYQYGMLNYCNRLCTELGVEFGWRAEHYQYMIRCALLNGEKEVARKYINILKQTMFYDDWAAKTEGLLDKPRLIAKDHEMEPITHMLHYSDVASGDQGYVERFLMNQLAKNSYSKDPIFQEQSLLASLWVKDPKLFWHHFYIYVSLHPNEPIPEAYQEAAYLFGKMEDRPNLDQLPFSQGVKDRFNRFYQVISQCEGMNIEDVRKRMERLHSNTFYYDYELMSKLPEY